MTGVLRGVSGALVALALVAGSTAMAPGGVAGKPNCQTLPCPPPTNGSAADMDGSARPGGVRPNPEVAGRGPNCLGVPCPPPRGA